MSVGTLRDIRAGGWRLGSGRLGPSFTEPRPSLGELPRPWGEDGASDGGGEHSDKTAELPQWREGRFRALGRVFLPASGLVFCLILVLLGASEGSLEG